MNHFTGLNIADIEGWCSNSLLKPGPLIRYHLAPSVAFGDPLASLSDNC